MNNNWNKCIVISAVNLVDGGTFTILQECLKEISNSWIAEEYNIYALVHNKENLPKSNITYIEYPKAKSNYLIRIYYEYLAFKRVSKRLKPELWVSLHDMSPRVETKVQAVYMHNPSPFLGKPKSFTLRGIAFSSLYRWVYRINIHANKYLIVQQDWLRQAFSTMFDFALDRIIVARPAKIGDYKIQSTFRYNNDEKVFVFASYPRGFKNYEVICRAVKNLVEAGEKRFRVLLTIDGSENDYSNKIFKKYSNINQIKFIGLLSHSKMDEFYSSSDCLIFPSQAETWGLPITEYMQYGKPMILSDLPYAHETASGAGKVAFFTPDNPDELEKYMRQVINEKLDGFIEVPQISVQPPFTHSWTELINLLLR